MSSEAFYPLYLHHFSSTLEGEGFYFYYSTSSVRSHPSAMNNRGSPGNNRNNQPAHRLLAPRPQQQPQQQEEARVGNNPNSNPPPQALASSQAQHIPQPPLPHNPRHSDHFRAAHQALREAVLPPPYTRNPPGAPPDRQFTDFIEGMPSDEEPIEFASSSSSSENGEDKGFNLTVNSGIQVRGHGTVVGIPRVNPVDLTRDVMQMLHSHSGQIQQGANQNDNAFSNPGSAAATPSSSGFESAGRDRDGRRHGRRTSRDATGVRSGRVEQRSRRLNININSSVVVIGDRNVIGSVEDINVLTRNHALRQAHAQGQGRGQVSGLAQGVAQAQAPAPGQTQGTGGAPRPPQQGSGTSDTGQGPAQQRPAGTPNASSSRGTTPSTVSGDSQK